MNNNDRRILRDYLLFIGFWSVLSAVLTVTKQWYHFLLFWVLPYLTSFQVVNWFCELGEHYPKLAQSNIDLFMSRNRLGPWWEKFMFGMHNEHLHLEHHLNPAIPFWNLPKARKIRLEDPTYAVIDENTGGLFVKGAKGGLSAISEMLKYHRQKR